MIFDLLPDPARRDEYVAAQTSALDAGRSEPGREEYSFLVDPERPNIVRIFERWADVPSFEAHLETLAQSATSPLASDAVRGATITRYDVATSSLLFGS